MNNFFIGQKVQIKSSDNLKRLDDYNKRSAYIGQTGFIIGIVSCYDDYQYIIDIDKGVVWDENMLEPLSDEVVETDVDSNVKDLIPINESTEENINDDVSFETETDSSTVSISKKLYDRLDYLGLIPNSVRDHNFGSSDYSEHLIQSWSIWLDYNLDPWESDIIKRVLRRKKTDPRRLDFEKIIHIAQEKIRQIDFLEKNQKKK